MQPDGDQRDVVLRAALDEPLEQLVEELLQRPVGELDQGVAQPDHARVQVGVRRSTRPSV